MKPERCPICYMRLRVTQDIHDITECMKPAKVSENSKPNIEKKRIRKRPEGRRTREQYYEDMRAKRRHGTKSMADAGCKCEPCRLARNEYSKLWKQARKAKLSA